MTPLVYLIIIDIFLAAIGQLLLKRGMTLMGPMDFSVNNIWPLVLNALKSIYIWVAAFCYVSGMILWMFILSKVKLSVAYPATSLIYVLVIFSSWLFLKESLGVYQIIGSVLVVAGLFFLFKSL